MNESYFITLAECHPATSWCIEYVQGGEYRTTFYREHSLIAAIERFEHDTDGRAYVVYAGIRDVD